MGSSLPAKIDTGWLDKLLIESPSTFVLETVVWSVDRGPLFEVDRVIQSELPFLGSRPYVFVSLLIDSTVERREGCDKIN